MFHHYSKDDTQRGEVNPGLAYDLWPDSWNTVHYKAYSTCKKIILHKIDSSTLVGEKNFFSLIKNRKSKREYSEKPVTIEEISLLLHYGCGVIEDSDSVYKRAHPSAGGNYPIEIYLYVNKSGGDIPTGIYHYNINDHTLDLLKEKENTKDFLAKNFTYDWIRNASVCIIFTAVFDRTTQKYGERGYRYILIEVGHISQNIYLLCEHLGLSCTGLGGTKDIEIEKTLDIDGVHESVIYGMSLGKE